MEDVLNQFATKFGQDALLTTSRGKVIDYIGMKIDYHKIGKVTFSMEDFIRKLLEKAPSNMDGI